MIKFFLAVVGLFPLLFLVIYFLQERWMFHAQVSDAGFLYRVKNHATELDFQYDGKRVHSLLVEVPSPRGLILFFHGNAGTLETWSNVADSIATQTKWNVWIYDYPGFGKSADQIRSEGQMHGIAEEFLKVARERFTDPNLKWAYYGRSLGSGIAIRLASKNPVAGVLLETPYYSFEDVVRRVAPWAPSFVLRYRFRSHLWLGDVQAPMMLIHGTADALIPYEHSVKLAALNPRARLVTVPGGEHSNLSQFPEYWSGIETFFAEISGNSESKPRR